MCQVKCSVIVLLRMHDAMQKLDRLNATSCKKTHAQQVQITCYLDIFCCADHSLLALLWLRL